MVDPGETELGKLAHHIRAEVDRIEEVVRHLEQSLERLREAPSLNEIHGAAAFVENFYALIEKLLARIARSFEGPPAGQSWHRDLLTQMSEERGERPPVISRDQAASVEEYLGFRHVRRNLYVFELDAVRVAGLIEHMRGVWEPIRAQLLEFAAVADGMANALRDDLG